MVGFKEMGKVCKANKFYDAKKRKRRCKEGVKDEGNKKKKSEMAQYSNDGPQMIKE